MIQKIKDTAGMLLVGTYLTFLTISGIVIVGSTYAYDQLKYSIRSWRKHDKNV